jgi:hypothetical protein
MTPTDKGDPIGQPSLPGEEIWKQRKAILLALLVAFLCLAPSLVPGRALLPQDLRSFAPFSSTDNLGAADAVSTAAVPHGRDELLQFLPFDQLVADSWSQGRVPLWSSDLFCGLPLLAQTTSRPFYPTALLHAVFSPASLYAWVYLIHLVLGGFFAYRLVRRIGGSESGAQLANLCLVLSGYSLGHLHHPMIWFAGVWILPALEAVTILFQRQGRRPTLPFLALALCTTLSWLAGFSQASVFLCYLVTGTAALLTILRWKEAGRPEWTAPLIAAGALATGLLLAAPQILPALEMAAHSSRLPATREQLVTASLPVAWLLEWVLPGQLNPPADLAILGSPRPGFLALWWTPTARYPALSANVFNHTETAFGFGIWPFLLALGTLPCLWSSKIAASLRVTRIWLWVIALLGLGMALCLPGFLDLSLLLPGLGVGDAKRNLLLPALALPLLAGLGYRNLPRSLLYAAAVGSLVCFAISAWALLAPGEQFAEFFGRRLAARHGEAALGSFLANISPLEIQQNQDHLGFGLLRAGLALGLVPALALTRFRPQAIYLATIIELLPLAWQMSPAPPRASTEARLTGLPQVLPSPRPRILRLDPGSASQGTSQLLPANLAILQGLAETGAYCPLPPTRSEAFFEVLEKGSTSRGAGISRLRDPASLSSPLLPLLAPRYLLSKGAPPGPGWRTLHQAGDTGLYEQEQTWPRARLFYAWEQSTGPEDLDEIRKKIEGKEDCLLLEQDPGIELSGADDQASVEVLEWGQGRIRLQYKSRKPALLFVSEAWMPGWQATIREQVISTIPAWLMFQAVPLPAHEGIVELHYAPTSFRNGLWLSVLGLILLGTGFLLFSRAARPTLDERS